VLSLFHLAGYEEKYKVVILIEGIFLTIRMFSRRQEGIANQAIKEGV